MFDFHLHLARLPHPTKVGQALLQAHCGFNNISCEPWEWDKSLELMKSLGDFAGSGETAFAFGIHPMVATRMSAADIDRLEQILRGGNHAVGECGLDKRFDGYEPGGVQEKIFLRQVEMAADLNRPLQIHCVGDYSRILRLIADVEHHKADQSHVPAIPQVTFHRFGGDVGFVKAALKQLGDRALFSLHADSFRKKSTAAAIAQIPAAQVRFETDADEDFKVAEQSIEAAAPTPPTEVSIIAEAILRQLRQAETKFF